MLADLLQGLTHLIYPPHCLFCKNHLSADSFTPYVCLKCQTRIQMNHPPFCPRCSRFVGNPPSSVLCPSCQRTHPAFNFAWCACFYNTPLKYLIHLFKYDQKTYLKNFLSSLMIRFIETYHLDIHQFDVFLPVPLSPTKLRERGYNQSHLLAYALSLHYNTPLNKNNLIKIRETRSQTLLSQKERWTNIAGAFRIKNSKYIKNKNILIIDDLLTTGATSSEAAKTLKQNGAHNVGVFTLAGAM